MRHKRFDPVFKDDLPLYLDRQLNLNIHSFHFIRPGNPIANYEKFEEKYRGVSGHIEKKLGSHRIVVGGQWQQRQIRSFAVSPNYGSFLEAYGIPFGGGTTEQQLSLRNSAIQEVFGYDIFGKKIDRADEVNDSPLQPHTFSFYAEDFYQLKNISLRLGLRYDNFFSDGLRLIRHDLIPGYDYFLNIPLSETRKAATYDYISPRVSMTLSLNSRIRLFFDLGKYVQQSRLKDIFTNRAKIINSMFRRYLNDPKAFDPALIRTTQSTLGAAYKISPHLTLKGVLFYKSGEGYLQTGNAFISPDSMSFSILNTDGTIKTKGLELNFFYRQQNKNLRLTYTYSDVDGTSSYPTSNLWITYRNNLRSKYFSFTSRPLEYNQKHRLNALLYYNTGTNSPWFLKNAGISLLFRFNSGHSYTLFDGYPSPFGIEFGTLLSDDFPILRSEVKEIITTPPNYQLDFRIDKSFVFGKAGFTLYLYIQNFLNYKNVIHVYRRTGATDDDGYKDFFDPAQSEEAEFIFYELININHRQHYQIRQGGDLFGRPREIRFGVKIHFGGAQNSL